MNHLESDGASREQLDDAEPKARGITPGLPGSGRGAEGGGARVRTGYPSPPSLGDVDSRGAPRGAGLRHGRGRGRRAPRDTVLADTRQLCVTHTVWTVLVKGGSKTEPRAVWGAPRTTVSRP